MADSMGLTVRVQICESYSVPWISMPILLGTGVSEKSIRRNLAYLPHVSHVLLASQCRGTGTVVSVTNVANSPSNMAADTKARHGRVGGIILSPVFTNRDIPCLFLCVCGRVCRGFSVWCHVTPELPDKNLLLENSGIPPFSVGCRTAWGHM